MSRLLLDTNVVLLAASGGAISPQAEAAIDDPLAVLVVSAAVAWEVATKRAIGRLRADVDLDDFLDAAGVERLPIGWQHARLSGELALHHRDPFDRIMVAQALTEGLAIVTRDRVIPRYGVPVIAA